MNVHLDQRIATLDQLGRLMGSLGRNAPWPGYSSGVSEEEYNTLTELTDTHHFSNGWFTPSNIRRAYLSWSKALTTNNLLQWLNVYELESIPKKNLKVGIICAGNIPMVGLHDVLTVLLTGHTAIIKLSSDDNRLIPAFAKVLIHWNPEFESALLFLEGRLSGADAVIATGSNNTSRYFNYYFREIPHVIRKSRTSVAVLDGSETDEELKALGSDIFDYFGLGCRNVSKIYLPDNYDLNKFFGSVYHHNQVIHHHKYANNYDYNKAVWLLNCEDILDNGFLLLKRDERVASPTGSLFYEYYKDRALLNESLASMSDQLQCIISRDTVAFGSAQEPQLWDYADGVDTVKFLLEASAGE